MVKRGSNKKAEIEISYLIGLTIAIFILVIGIAIAAFLIKRGILSLDKIKALFGFGG